MSERKSGLVFGRVSSDAVREATGRSWEEWFEVLDAAGAMAMNHKEIVALLERVDSPVESAWWRQSVTVAYEQARGKRVLGETSGSGFQVGVQRSIGATPRQVWDVLTSRPELWLGEGASVEIAPGARFEAPRGAGDSGVSGEIRVVKPGVRLRLTWKLDGWDTPATLQITLGDPGTGKTTVGAQFEKLPDAEAREVMREHWRGVLARLAAGVEAG